MSVHSPAMAALPVFPINQPENPSFHTSVLGKEVYRFHPRPSVCRKVKFSFINLHSHPAVLI